ncbi:MAG: molybdate ABC transporter substrate-binding protein [Thalassovita sp.]
MLRHLALLMMLLPAPLWAQDVTVFAAASLKTALEDVASAWTAQTGHTATLSFAGSSALARQIDAGAPADIFISANQGWMDHLAALGVIQTDSRVDLLGNTLVLIGPAGSAPLGALGPETDLTSRIGADRMAMALIQAVPAGIYGKAALTALGLWPQVADKIAQTDNVRAALALVALGEAPLGVTYASDAMAQPRVTVLATFPDTSHPAILYPAAITTESTGPQATEFLTFLQSDTAKDIFRAAGFLIPEDE